MGNRLGRTLKVDMNTTYQLRGLFARVCVLLDLNKAFVSGFTLDGENYYLEYEGLHLLCSKCGRYGHHPEGCLKAMDTAANHVVNDNRSPSMNPGEQNMETRESGPPSEVWKVVQKPRRQQKSKDKAEDAVASQQMGSQFQALVTHYDERIDAVENEAIILNHVPPVQSFVAQKLGKQKEQRSGKWSIMRSGKVVSS